MRKILISLVTLVFAGIACSIGGVSGEVECRPIEECEQEIVEVTRVVTKEVEVEKIVDVIIDATYTPLPSYTPLPTLEPIIVTATLTPLPDIMAERGAGYYLVNIEIAPGVWRNDGTTDNCYWEITDQTGETIDNHFGMGGGTMYIPPNAYQVQLEAECGNWVWLQP